MNIFAGANCQSLAVVAKFRSMLVQLTFQHSLYLSSFVSEASQECELQLPKNLMVPSAAAPLKFICEHFGRPPQEQISMFTGHHFHFRSANAPQILPFKLCTYFMPDFRPFFPGPGADIYDVVTQWVCSKKCSRLRNATGFFRSLPLSLKLL